MLLALHRAGLSTLALRERLARAAAKSGDWDEAVVVLEQLMLERVTPEERAEAARLCVGCPVIIECGQAATARRRSGMSGAAATTPASRERQHDHT